MDGTAPQPSYAELAALVTELRGEIVRLKKAIPVVISAERKNVIDPLYLQLFNPQTILLVVDANLSPDTAPPTAPVPPIEAPPTPPAEALPAAAPAN